MGEFDEALFERRWSNEKIGRILTRMGIFKRAKKRAITSHSLT